MKLMPASRAFAMIREEVASSVGPPNIMVPRQIGEIFRPLRPSWRYFICSLLAVIPGRCEASNPESRDSGSGPSDHPGMTTSLVLQYLEHAVGHGEDALLHRHFRGDEDQASRRAYHARPGTQHLANLAGLDEMRVELHGRQRRLARDIAGGHAA